MVRSKTWIGYLAILAVGLGLTGAVGAYWMHEYGAVREHYIANSAAKTRFVADKVESAFSEIYQNIRTLSLLPALKTVDRNGTYLSPEAKITIQQIYNNLASNADVSEVYFLPVNFDPEKIDPGTGHHEAPILAFDQLIAPIAQPMLRAPLPTPPSRRRVRRTRISSAIPTTPGYRKSKSSSTAS